MRMLARNSAWRGASQAVGVEVREGFDEHLQAPGIHGDNEAGAAGQPHLHVAGRQHSHRQESIRRRPRGGGGSRRLRNALAQR